MRVERVDIVGAGGIGSAVGYALKSCVPVVRFIEANEAKLAWGRRVATELDSPVISFDEWEPTPGSIVFLCYDNAHVLAKLPHDVILIPVQNGFDTQLDARSHAVEGIASFVATTPQPDVIVPKITRPGELHFGPRRVPQCKPGEAKTILAWLRSVFKPTEARMWFEPKFVSNILPIKHTKLMYNAAISPLAAAAGLDNGALLSLPTARRLFFALLLENYRILTKAGCELGRVGPLHPRMVYRILQSRWLASVLAKRFEPSLRGTYCSMAGEIERGRTEIDNYTGYLLILAANRINAPLNRAVYQLVTRMQTERTTPHVGVLEQLQNLA
jgi:2-dehydropantoate 2-reductase